MDQYVGLDVSMKETSISVRQNRKRIWRGKCLSDPQLVAEMIRQHAPDAVLVVFETGPLATWFHPRGRRRINADLCATSASKEHKTPLDECVANREPKCFT